MTDLERRGMYHPAGVDRIWGGYRWWRPALRRVLPPAMVLLSLRDIGNANEKEFADKPFPKHAGVTRLGNEGRQFRMESRRARRRMEEGWSGTWGKGRNSKRSF